MFTLWKYFYLVDTKVFWFCELTHMCLDTSWYLWGPPELSMWLRRAVVFLQSYKLSCQTKFICFIHASHSCVDIFHNFQYSHIRLRCVYNYRYFKVQTCQPHIQVVTEVWDNVTLKKFCQWYDTTKWNVQSYFYQWINRECELFSI